MSLSRILKIVTIKDNGLGSWVADYELRAEKVARFRRYVDGEHDNAFATPELIAALRIPAGIKSAYFLLNKCDDVIQSETDRLRVNTIEGDNDAASEWADDVLEYSRFDELQIDTHEATLRDADSYILVEFDEADDKPYFCHELAWDGMSGMLVIHKSDDKNTLAAAIKVWTETKESIGDTVRVNVYYPDRIEKWVGGVMGDLVHFDDPAMPGVWPLPHVMRDGTPIGVPVVQFKNKSRGKGGFGKSELEDAIPPQDAINRTLHSAVMTSELAGIPVRVAEGFDPPAAVTPGMWVVIGKGGIEKDQHVKAYNLEGTDVEPQIKLMEYLEEQIETITRTPNPKGGANISGEALKQLEIKLIGKVERFQVKGGNSWEDVMALAVRMQDAYGIKSPPATKRWYARWKDAQIRNDAQIIANAEAVKEEVGTKEYLRLLAPVLGYDDKKIDTIMKERAEEMAERMAAMERFNPMGGTQFENDNGANGGQPNPNLVNNGATV